MQHLVAIRDCNTYFQCEKTTHRLAPNLESKAHAVHQGFKDSPMESNQYKTEENQHHESLHSLSSHKSILHRLFNHSPLIPTVVIRKTYLLISTQNGKNKQNVRFYCSWKTIEQEMSRKNVRSYCSPETVEPKMTRKNVNLIAH